MLFSLTSAAQRVQGEVDFDRDIAPILASRCSSCHGPAAGEGGLRLIDRQSALAELDSGSRAIVPGEPTESVLLARVRSTSEGERMPPKGERLTDEQITKLEQWIEQGAAWPRHWAYRPLQHPALPVVSDPAWQAWAHNPIDRFVLARMLERGLEPSPQASRRVLLRRVYFDLIGLPPSSEQLDEFLADRSPLAYERVVERLLASPRYGERWARHWMDLVHFAETHGNDQDRPREHAWPYRDYLIASLNADKPFDRFASEQIAGDALYPDSAEAIVATGMLAAGPWDESSLRDIREDTIDREIARYLDRDDIVSTVVSTFLSTTIHCARCHDHKFDPITQREYYGLQAVFAGVDKATREYDADARVARRRTLIAELTEQLAQIEQQPDEAAVAQLLVRLEPAGPLAHAEDSQQALREEVARWETQVSERKPTWQIVSPEQFTSAEGASLELQPDASVLSSGTRPETDVYTLRFRPHASRITGLRLEVLSDERLPQRGPGRQDNGNLHLNEIRINVFTEDQASKKQPVPIASAAADFNQEGWSIELAIDQNSATAWGIHPEVGKSHWATLQLADPIEIRAGMILEVELEQSHGRGHLIGRLRTSITELQPPWPADAATLPADIAAILHTPPEGRAAAQQARLAVYFAQQQLRTAADALPPLQKVYCGTNLFQADGSFRPAAVPRPVHVLVRGDVRQPLEPSVPAALALLPELAPTLPIADAGSEGHRRAALARWVTDRSNVLLWRSIVNRIWLHHFGQGIVDTPNDFGRLGAPPTHPQLLDWLAGYLQQHHGSLKNLHRLIVTSQTYRQTSQHDPSRASIDGDNRYLWKMPRRRLDAESLRDAVLQISGQLDLTMGGPSVRQFIQTPGVAVTPNVDYLNFAADDPAQRRRSVYRFLFRTLPDPFMDALDCPDASQLAPQRSSSITALQALALLNDHVLVYCSQQAAERLRAEQPDPVRQIETLYEAILLRPPTASELQQVAAYADRFGLANAARVLLNSNEFVFVD